MRSSLPFLCFAFVFTLTGCGGSHEPTDAPSLAQCYATEFGASPPAGVSHLQAKQIIIGDAGGAWLRFVADPDTFAGVVAPRFTPCDYGTFSDGRSVGVNAPTWWRPTANATTAFYFCSHWRRGTTNYSEAVLAYDRADHVVYFHHGISF